MSNPHSDMVEKQLHWNNNTAQGYIFWVYKQIDINIFKVRHGFNYKSVLRGHFSRVNPNCYGMRE